MTGHRGLLLFTLATLHGKGPLASLQICGFWLIWNGSLRRHPKYAMTAFLAFFPYSAPDLNFLWTLGVNFSSPFSSLGR